MNEIIEIVREASHIMTDRAFTVREKHGLEDLVTSSDVAVQEFLCSRLSALLPGSGFLCEEEDVKALDSRYVWIIDPIDGTMNFARHIPECAICVALEVDGVMESAVVYNPFRDELFTAERGRGAFLNGSPIHVSQRPLEDAVFECALCNYRKEFEPQCSAVISEMFHRVNDIRRFGSCALEMCYIAMGRFELHFEMRVQPWDIAAAGLILREAGGCICSLHGSVHTYRRPELICCANSPENLSALSAVVSRHIPEIPYTD
ncbi:MAG: inositol monophosphatase [Bacteroidales bacterium]|nr:inositol monophosphatase [Bacteroidales bacterium]